MKYTEKEYKKEVDLLYNKQIEVIGHFKGLMNPILIKDQYGLIKLKTARQLLHWTPNINSAVNKTLYFLSMLKDKQPNIFLHVKIISEYITAKAEILCETKFGIVKTTPDALLAGHLPTIRSALNRKEYFKNQLISIYGDLYDFKITTTDRHGGKSILICKEHGEVEIDNDYIFQGKGCPKCANNRVDKNVLYIIELFNDTDTFYKIGISYKINDYIRRFSDYIRMGYSINLLKERDFSDSSLCKKTELNLKHYIKPFLITPKNWPAETSTECFKIDILGDLYSLLNDDIV